MSACLEHWLTHGLLGQAFDTREMNYRFTVDEGTEISVIQNPRMIVIAGKITDCINHLGNLWDHLKEKSIISDAFKVYYGAWLGLFNLVVACRTDSGPRCEHSQYRKSPTRSGRKSINW
jgi:hypothetical protein